MFLMSGTLRPTLKPYFRGKVPFSQVSRPGFQKKPSSWSQKASSASQQHASALTPEQRLRSICRDARKPSVSAGTALENARFLPRFASTPAVFAGSHCLNDLAVFFVTSCL
jgi:hypothetical protein